MLKPLQNAKKDATFSLTRQVRYRLSRIWARELGIVNFIGLNPSTADETLDDQTIRRCMVYAHDWGFGGIVMTNVLAYRATNPKSIPFEYMRFPDALNQGYVVGAAMDASIIVCAWGAEKVGIPHAERIVKRLRAENLTLHYLRLTKEGIPSHPLRLPKSLTPTQWQFK